MANWLTRSCLDGAGARFSKVPISLSHRESRSKVLNLVITELSYSHFFKYDHKFPDKFPSYNKFQACTD